MNINDTYIIRVEIADGLIYTYTGKVVSEDEHFLTFIDKYGKSWTYNKNRIVSMEEKK